MKLLLVPLLLASHLRADVIYETDFDDFATGANQWSANASWTSNDTTSGAQSIDEDVLPALLKTASLGFVRPARDVIFVALDLGYDHIASGAPVVEIDTLIGIEDSTNNRRDDFSSVFTTLAATASHPFVSIMRTLIPSTHSLEFGGKTEPTSLIPSLTLSPVNSSISLPRLTSKAILGRLISGAFPSSLTSSSPTPTTLSTSAS